jgi:hypothetical protein
LTGTRVEAATFSAYRNVSRLQLFRQQAGDTRARLDPARLSGARLARSSTWPTFTQVRGELTLCQRPHRRSGGQRALMTLAERWLWLKARPEAATLNDPRGLFEQ